MDTPTPATVTPEQASTAAAAQVVADRIAEQEKRVADSLDIRDPGRPRESPSPEQIQLQQAASQKPIRGATADGGYTPDLLARAASQQIPEAEARQYQPQHLERLLGRLESQPVFEPDYEEEPQQQPFAFDPYTGQPLQQQPQQFNLPPLDPAKYEGDLVEAWEHNRQLLYQQQQELAEMRGQARAQQQQFQQAQQAARQQQDMRDYNTLEAAIARDESMKDVFGTGPAHQLVGTSHHAARAQVANLMDDMSHGMVRRGQPVPDVTTLYQMAKQALYGQRGNTGPQEQTLERMRNRAGQFIARPTATTRADGWEGLPQGEDRAVGAVAQALRNQRNGNN
jgi:hypothetical protein